MTGLIKHFLVLITFLRCISFSSAQDALYFGTTGEDIANSIYTYNNRIYLLGTTRKTDTSSLDYYVVQLNEKGGKIDETVFGGPHGDVGKDIFVDDEGIFILGKSWDGGYPNNDMTFYNFSHEGEEQWKKFYGGAANDLGQKFIRTKDGGFAMVGHNRSVDDLGDVYIVKANKVGKVIWENHFGGRYVDHGFDVVENAQGEFIIVGTLGGFYNPTTFDFLNHDADIYIIKTNADGELIWEKTFGGTNHDWAKKIIAVSDGEYLICGSTQSEGAGSFDMFLMKMDDNGNQIWFKTYGGNDFEYGETITESTDGFYYLLGTSASFSENFKPDHLLAKINSEGELIWQKIFGGEGSDYSSDLVCAADSGCYFTGYTDIGEFGNKDIVLYKISKNGTPMLLSSFPTINDSIEQIQVFPNPAYSEFSIKIDTKLTDSLTIHLYNSQGKRVFEEMVPPNIRTYFQPGLGSGMYFITVQYKNQVVYNGKLVFQ